MKVKIEYGLHGGLQIWDITGELIDQNRDGFMLIKSDKDDKKHCIAIDKIIEITEES